MQASETISPSIKAYAAAAAAVPDVTIDTMRNMLLNSARNEIINLLQDNIPTNIITGATEAELKRSRVVIEDVLINASETLHHTKANIVSGKGHIVSAADSLRKNINVIQKSVDSHLKTDYLKTFQEFSDQLQALMAAISAIQGSNKSVEATQRFMNTTLGNSSKTTVTQAKP